MNLMQKKKVPPLGALRVFEAAARHGSFVGAAQELSVTPAAVSHQIKLLEHWLKFKLFDRAAQGVLLTHAGRDYALRIRDAFDVLLASTEQTRQGRKKSVVTIRSQFSVASMWLTPRLIGLQAVRPDIEVSVVALPERFDSKVNADILLYESAPRSGYVSEQLIQGHFRVYASAGWAARDGNIRPKTVLSKPLIHTVSTLNLRLPSFEDWFAAAHVDVPSALTGMRFNLIHLTAAACIAGAGYALLHDAFCLDSVRAGSLIAINGPVLPDPHPIYIHTRNKATDDVIAVQNWLLKNT